MSKWKVWNTHPQGLTHREKFRDVMIEIPGNSYVEMDYEDAIQFRGQHFPTKLDAMGQQLPETYKCIKVEPMGASVVAVDSPEHVCHFDGKKFNSAKELGEYVSANYADRIFKDDVLDEEIKKRPGRPRKEVEA